MGLRNWCSPLITAVQLVDNAGVLHGSFGGPFQEGCAAPSFPSTPPPLSATPLITLSFVFHLHSALSQLAENLRVNVVGNAAVTEAFLPLLRKGQGKQVWFAASGLNSFGGPLSETDVGAPGAASKAAEAMWGVSLATLASIQGLTSKPADAF